MLKKFNKNSKIQYYTAHGPDECENKNIHRKSQLPFHQFPNFAHITTTLATKQPAICIFVFFDGRRVIAKIKHKKWPLILSDFYV